jgi:hypothetical protein
MEPRAEGAKRPRSLTENRIQRGFELLGCTLYARSHAFEYMPNYFEAYVVDELIGTFSSKVEAAAVLLFYAEGGAFAQ